MRILLKEVTAILTFTLDLLFWLGVTVFCDTSFRFMIPNAILYLSCVHTWLKLIPMSETICLKPHTVHIELYSRPKRQSSRSTDLLPRIILISVLKPTAPRTNPYIALLTLFNANLNHPKPNHPLTFLTYPLPHRVVSPFTK